MKITFPQVVSAIAIVGAVVLFALGRDEGLHKTRQLAQCLMTGGQGFRRRHSIGQSPLDVAFH